jgi:hypothetical protein
MSSDDKTVAVPVELLRRVVHSVPGDLDGLRNDLLALDALIPKPKPRLVAVDQSYFEQIVDNDGWRAANEWLSAQPDLLTVLDGVIDEWRKKGGHIIGSNPMPLIRKALGVDHAE